MCSRVHVYVRMCAHFNSDLLRACHGMHVEVRGQLAVVSVLLPCGSWESQSGRQACGKCLSSLCHLTGPELFLILLRSQAVL